MNLLLSGSIVILLFALAVTLFKYGIARRKLRLMEKEQGKLEQSALLLQNINAYYLLVNRDYVVCDTNYYSLNGLPAPDEGMVKKVGNLLHCRTAIEAGECGKGEKCGFCSVRRAIGKAFQEKAGIKKLEASMYLLDEDAKQVVPCDVSVSGTYMNLRGEDALLLTVCDVTELMNMQRLLNIEKENSQSVDKLRSAFIANMSHEVRTPLNAILGFSGLIVTAATEEERKLYADVIAENNERLLHLVDDIFDLSQIEAGTLEFEYSEFDVNDLLREAEGIFKIKLADNPAVKLVCEAQMQPVIMYSERQRIIQVMINLLHNAMKFTRSGEIRLGCSRIGADEVRFYVSDTGIGIPQEEQESIFARFKKLDREVPGTGLGLTLSQNIIKKLGGKVGVESEVGKGSTFWFVLPLAAKCELEK